MRIGLFIINLLLFSSLAHGQDKIIELPDDTRSWEAVIEDVKNSERADMHADQDAERLRELKDARTFPLLSALAHDTSPPNVRGRAVFLIGYLDPKRAFDVLATIALNEKEDAVLRQLALNSLRSTDNPRGAEIAATLADEKDPSLRGTAYFVLSAQHTPQSYQILIERLKSDHTETRRVILNALTYSAYDHAERLLPLIDLKSESSDFVSSFLLLMIQKKVGLASEALLPTLTHTDELVRHNAALYFSIIPLPSAADGMMNVLRHQKTFNATPYVQRYLENATLAFPSRVMLAITLKMYGKPAEACGRDCELR